MAKRYIFAIVIGLIVALGIIAALTQPLPGTPGILPGDVAVCTQEAMICPDGTAVGRAGPMCEFAPCPDIDILVIAEPPSQTVSKGGYSFVIATSSVQISKGGKIIQTIATDPDSPVLRAVQQEVIGSEKLVFTDADINFDGHADLGILTGVGYGGVNYFYGFYLYDTKTGMFAKTAVLSEIGNPSTDPAKKQVISSYRSGPQWYSRRFQFLGNSFTDLGEIPDSEASE